MDKFDIITIIIYIIIVIVIVILIKVEKIDLTCPNPSNKDDQICELGRGSPYFAGKIDKDDDNDTILDKIKLSARYEINTIIWRRMLILSFILSFIILIVIEKSSKGLLRLPNIIDFISVTLIIYLGIYIMTELYQQWITNFAIEQIDEAVDALR